MISRRHFIGTTTATLAAFASRNAFATPLGLPLGIQLYSVREQMAHDLDAALAGVAAAGFIQVEAAALPKKPAKEIRAALDKAGLKCVSSHHGLGELQQHFDETVAFEKELGVSFIVCPSPGRRTWAPAGKPQPPMTLDDWHYSAEQFNLIGDKLGPLGIRFAYHNHTPEFAITEGKTPYMELLRLTDPTKVSFELDCGWAVVGGVSPVDIMRTHPNRIVMLHVKDFTIAPGQGDKVTELGRGSIDYRPIFAQAAKTQHIAHAFVEQEAFDMPWQESLKVDAAYMRGL